MHKLQMQVSRHRIENEVSVCDTKRLVLNWVVIADEADVVINQLNIALDELEEKHTIFGGDIETIAFDHSGRRRRSGLGAYTGCR
jgi:hypothetical protein